MSTWPDFRPTDLLAKLVLGGVDFVVIGGVAVIMRGAARLTKDLDVVYTPDPDNLERLGRALIDLGARPRGIDPELPFIPDASTIARTEILTLETELGGLDLLRNPSGSPGWDKLRERAELVDLGIVGIRVAGIDDLLAMKRATGRPQDLIDIDTLETAKRLGGR
jgi:hypothetical protein